VDDSSKMRDLILIYFIFHMLCLPSPSPSSHTCTTYDTQEKMPSIVRRRTRRLLLLLSRYTFPSHITPLPLAFPPAPPSSPIRHPYYACIASPLGRTNQTHAKSMAEYSTLPSSAPMVAPSHIVGAGLRGMRRTAIHLAAKLPGSPAGCDSECDGSASGILRASVLGAGPCACNGRTHNVRLSQAARPRCRSRQR
jgi:hypothetical protein